MKRYHYDQWENGVASDNYTYYSRFIASWINAGGYELGGAKGRVHFRKWLESLGWLSELDIIRIAFLASNGKLELEDDAKRYIEECETINNEKKES